LTYRFVVSNEALTIVLSGIEAGMSLRTIAEKAKINRSTVDQAVKLLVERKKIKKKDAAKKGQKSVYEVLKE